MFKPELLHIVSWNLLELSVTEDPEETGDQFNYNLSNKADFAFNTEEKLVRVELEIEITKVSEEDRKSSASARVKVEYVYLVENLEELHKIDDNDTLIVDNGLIANLSGISFSTTRGLILQRFRDTSFEGFILPIVSVADEIETNAGNP